MNLKESHLLLIIVLIVFAGVFYLATNINGSVTEVEGVKIYSDGDLKQNLQSVVAKTPVLIQLELLNGTDKRNSALAIISAELAANLKLYGKESLSYGFVDGVPSINCNANTSNCSGASIFIRIGECNCLRVSKQKAEIDGTYDFYLDNKHVRAIKGLFGLAASGQ